MRSTPDDHRGLIIRRQRVHRLPQHLQVFKPARPVRVDHQETATARVEHPMAHRAALPEVLFEGDDTDVGRGVLRGEGERQGGRAVFGAVVDDEELVCPCPL